MGGAPEVTWDVHETSVAGVISACGGTAGPVEGIANFEADDIAYVTAALDAFKGRIERDDWMGSAAAEHLKKYGEPA